MFAKIAWSCLALACALIGTTTAHAADPEHPTATFTVSSTTAIPGRVLAPGTYSIHVVDHLSDRYILRVEGQGGKDKTLFIGIMNKAADGMSSASKSGEVKWTSPANGDTYLRGWSFASLPSPLEFAYPKADAVAVAKANQAQVPAIDPESEGMVKTAGLSTDEMHIITLWLLTPTHVGPQDAGGIKAERFQAAGAQHAAAGGQQLASATHKPAKLPHTASDLPWLWLVGSLSLAGALGMRGLRRASLS